MSTLIKKVKIMDANSTFYLTEVDVLVTNGMISAIGACLEATADTQIIQGDNLFLSNGWVDVMADYADPGLEHKETIITGASAAKNGGFRHVFVVPNTHPVIGNKAMVDYVVTQGKLTSTHIYPIGAASKNTEGKDLAEMIDMHTAGAIAFSDGWKPIDNAQLMLKSLEYVKTFDGVVIQLPVYSSLAKGGLMNEGFNSVRLGMPGIPVIAESLLVHRDIELLRYTNSRLHFSGISTAASLALIRAAKNDGLDVTCSVTPYHLLYNDNILSEYDSNFKVMPPIRSEEDRLALIAALEDGTIDCIASHHRPQEWDAKAKEYEYTEYGMMTQETVFSMLQMAAPEVTMEQWVALLSTNARKIFKLKTSSIEVDQPADLTVIAPEEIWVFNNANKRSKGINSPLLGKELIGKAFCI